MCGTIVKFKTDLGADITIMDERNYRNEPEKPHLQPTFFTLGSPGGQVPGVGQFSAVVNFKTSSSDSQSL